VGPGTEARPHQRLKPSELRGPLPSGRTATIARVHGTLAVESDLSAARPQARREATDKKVFLWAAAATVVLVVGFIAWMYFTLGGQAVTIGVDDIGEAVAGFIATACCGLAAWRNSGKQRLGWALLSASAATWSTGEVVWSVYEVGLHIEVPYPSAADIGFLSAIPLAAAGILCFFSTPRGTSTRLRLWLDGAIVFLALFFVAWTLGLKTVYADTQDPLFEKIIDLAYPVSDAVIGTILVLAIRRARDESHGRLLLLLGGLAANSIADSAFSFLTATGAYGPNGSLLDTGWVAGYLMIGLAALWPAAPARKVEEVGKDLPIDTWQLALPWVAILVAGATAVVLGLTGNEIGPVRTVIVGAIAILVMVSQVYAHNESMSLLVKSRLSAATLNDIISFAPLGVVRIGVDLTIIQANPRFAYQLRRPLLEMSGATLTSYLPPEEAERAAAQFRALSGGSAGAVDTETEAIRGDGTTMWLHWSATAVRKADGEVDYFIAMFNDTTARHEAEVAAVANLNVLERLNRLKSEFLTMVRHEFRTALVGIQGFSELMRDSEHLDGPTINAFADDIYNDAHRLDQLLDRMLDLDHADRVEIHHVPIDLGAALVEAVTRAGAAGTSKQITTELDADLPPVDGDAVQLAQLLGILLDNAIKYSPHGGEIEVSGTAEPGQVVITVKDHGDGMPADFDDQLFARYQWSANNPTTKVMGTGLGLPMARQIVEMHGGRIWFESIVGVGSAFHFSLPLHSNGATPNRVRVQPLPVAAA
jgi:PAS domain S-box-containing protein